MTIHQRIRGPLLGAAAAVLALIGGVTYASTATANSPASAPGLVAAVHHHGSRASAHTLQVHAKSTARRATGHGTPAKAAETTGEHSGESDSASEQEPSSDGPGGHADPAGNVDHQFDGQE